jgi:hypothetical protein
VINSKEWSWLAPRYDTVMMADDDLLMSTHTINEAFRIFTRHNLSLAQPSVCQHSQSYSLQPAVMQQEGIFLR